LLSFMILALLLPLLFLPPCSPSCPTNNVHTILRMTLTPRFPLINLRMCHAALNSIHILYLYVYCKSLQEVPNKVIIIYLYIYSYQLVTSIHIYIIYIHRIEIIHNVHTEGGTSKS
jgi:hypothetical protein